MSRHTRPEVLAQTAKSLQQFHVAAWVMALVDDDDAPETAT
jgi:hypothetical protein